MFKLKQRGGRITLLNLGGGGGGGGGGGVTQSHPGSAPELNRSMLSGKRRLSGPQQTKPRSAGVRYLKPIDLNMETATPSAVENCFLVSACAARIFQPKRKEWYQRGSLATETRNIRGSG